MTKEELEEARARDVMLPAKDLTGYTRAAQDRRALLAHIDELTAELAEWKRACSGNYDLYLIAQSDIRSLRGAQEKAETHAANRSTELLAAIAAKEKVEAERDRFRKALEEIADMPPAFNLGWKVATDTLNGEK